LQAKSAGGINDERMAPISFGGSCKEGLQDVVSGSRCHGGGRSSQLLPGWDS